MENFSQTQLSNIAMLAGLLVIVANQFGFVLKQDEVVFVIAALWQIGWGSYSYYQRFKKGDLTIAGVRK